MYGTDKPRLWGNRIDLSGMLAFLRRVHPTKTAEGVAAATGIPQKTIAKWFEERTEPRGRYMLTLMFVYGPALAAACVKDAPRWLDKAVASEQHERIKSEIERGQRELAELESRL